MNNTGEIDLSNGWLQDISTIRRGPADALVKYDHKLLTISFDITFDDLYVSDLHIFLYLRTRTSSLKAELQPFVMEYQV